MHIGLLASDVLRRQRLNNQQFYDFPALAHLYANIIFYIT